MLVRLRVSAASSRLIHCHHHVRRPIVRVVAFQTVRTYATPGRPKSVVGETSKPVKRTTSRAKSTSTSTKTTAAKTTSSRSTTKKSAAKKAVPKKAAPKKKTKPVKKSLTEEQKIAQKDKLLKRKASDKKKADLEAIKTLKQQALKPPLSLNANKVSGFNVYIADSMKNSTDTSTPGRDKIRLYSKRYATLSDSEKEALNKRAVDARETRRAELKKWIESHTAAEIGAANRARARLNKLYPAEPGKFLKYQPIPDQRLPKRALSAWMIFFGDRTSTGDYANLEVRERMDRIVADYKQLTPDQRRDLDRKSEASRSAYEKSYLAVYGKAPPARANKAEAVAA